MHMGVIAVLLEGMHGPVQERLPEGQLPPHTDHAFAQKGCATTLTCLGYLDAAVAG